MKLIDLEPQFIRRTSDSSWKDVHRPEDADGIMFLCPKCFTENKGNIGTHTIICWSPRVGQEVQPNPGRWQILGTGYSDLSLVAGQSSVWLTGAGCKAHFFVQAGNIVPCDEQVYL